MHNMHSNFQYLFFSRLYPFEQVRYKDIVYGFLWHLNFEYSGFRRWYLDLFTDTHSLRNEREILICSSENSVFGVAILKRDEEESKICTLRVSRGAQRSGIGKQLSLKSFDWLETDKPLITVRSYKEFQFEKLFQYFGFKREEVFPRYYGLLGTEIAYNGILPAKKNFHNQFLRAESSSFLEYFLWSGRYPARQLIEMCNNQYHLCGAEDKQL